MHLYPILKNVVAGIIKPIWRPKLFGEQHMPVSGPAIMACNHQAAAETYFVPCLMKREVHWLGKDSLFNGSGPWGRIFAWLMRSVNVIPVDRSGPGKAHGALETGVRVLREGKVLGLFPEGTRSPDGRLYKGKTGAVRLALATGAPIVPVAVINAFESRSGSSVLPKLTPRIQPTMGPALDMRRELALLRSQHLSDAEKPTGVAVDGAPEADGPELRALTRILMEAIQEMSGQEYVDIYAAERKRQLREDDTDSPAA